VISSHAVKRIATRGAADISRWMSSVRSMSSWTPAIRLNRSYDVRPGAIEKEVVISDFGGASLVADKSDLRFRLSLHTLACCPAPRLFRADSYTGLSGGLSRRVWRWAKLWFGCTGAFSLGRPACLTGAT